MDPTRNSVLQVTGRLEATSASPIPPHQRSSPREMTATHAPGTWFFSNSLLMSFCNSSKVFGGAESSVVCARSVVARNSTERQRRTIARRNKVRRIRPPWHYMRFAIRITAILTAKSRRTNDCLSPWTAKAPVRLPHLKTDIAIDASAALAYDSARVLSGIRAAKAPGLSTVKRLFRIVIWLAVAVLGAGALGAIAFRRGEPLNAMWFVVAAVCCCLVAYRLYSAFVGACVL